MQRSAMCTPSGTSSSDNPNATRYRSLQAFQFLASVGEERLAPAYVLATHTGMRRGEIAGLRWADIDLAAKLIHIRQAVTVIAYAPEHRRCEDEQRPAHDRHQ